METTLVLIHPDFAVYYGWKYYPEFDLEGFYNKTIDYAKKYKNKYVFLMTSIVEDTKHYFNNWLNGGFNAIPLIPAFFNCQPEEANNKFLTCYSFYEKFIVRLRKCNFTVMEETWSYKHRITEMKGLTLDVGGGFYQKDITGKATGCVSRFCEEVEEVGGNIKLNFLYEIIYSFGIKPETKRKNVDFYNNLLRETK